MNIFRSTTTTPIASNSLNRSHFRWTTLPARAISLFLTTISFSQAATIITFDVPGAGTGPFLGTQPLAINMEGVITGFYSDASNALHGFVRATNGAITSFDVPGGGTGPDEGTSPRCINPGGVIAGDVVDAGFSAVHGFVRAADGAITTFDVPGAVFTIANDINPEGVIAGTYLDASFVAHGFMRAANGTITTFDAPGAVQTPARAPFRVLSIASTRRGKSRDSTLTRAMQFTPSCAPQTALSPRSTFRALSVAHFR
jgi:predicted membrane protein